MQMKQARAGEAEMMNVYAFHNPTDTLDVGPGSGEFESGTRISIIRDLKNPENLKPGQGQTFGFGLALAWLGLSHGFWQGNQLEFGFGADKSQAKPKPTPAKAKPKSRFSAHFTGCPKKEKIEKIAQKEGIKEDI
ncbi:hypothetical protein B0H11DRAFT_2199271 [Mycena galericulata]|nr:hypothetical protein B0H11DRAFT_2199271 [Mycena galericulata]